MFVLKYNEILSIMQKRLEDDDIMNLFVLQLEIDLLKTHVFRAEWLFWYKRIKHDLVRVHNGIWKLVHDLGEPSTRC